VVDAAVLARKVAAIRDAVDFTRVHAVALAELDDLLTFCDELAARVRF